jgi:hypothetical protein
MVSLSPALSYWEGKCCCVFFLCDKDKINTLIGYSIVWSLLCIGAGPSFLRKLIWFLGVKSQTMTSMMESRGFGFSFFDETVIYM